MKRYLPMFSFLTIALFLFAYSWAQELPEIIIEDADATTTIDLVSPPTDFFDAGEVAFRLPNQALVCRADEEEVINLTAPPEDFFDASEVDLRLPNEAAVCRADETFTIDLVAPPAEFFNPAPDFVDKFVYVALGDSYQSGEGAGNSISNSADYLSQAYEVGTYTDILVAGDNSCHRALQNYAKINKNEFYPELNDDNIVLIDLTCSGAKIENGDQLPVVGDMMGGQIASNSQLQQALNKLAELNLTPVDVDLATVGMGGNDAKFADIVNSCLAPNIIRKILSLYPNTPWTIESEFALHLLKMSSCEEADKTMGVDSEKAINDLIDKEKWAQNMLLESFPNAKIMQLTYPNILPQKEVAPAWCGGIAKSDVDYARGRIEKINQKIKEAAADVVAETGIGGENRLMIADVERALGKNALCPSLDDLALANGIKESNFEAEARRLLNLDGNGDAQSRALIDNLSNSYKSWKNCLALNVALDLTTIPFECDAKEKWNKLLDDGQFLINYLNDDEYNQDRKKLILANLAKLPNSQESESIRYDRSRGLFHPNMKGHALLACNVRAAYKDMSLPLACPVSDIAIIPDTANGSPVSVVPINIFSGEKIDIIFRGFAPFSSVIFWIHSTPINLGNFIADANGDIFASLSLPDIDSGVHTIIAEGEAGNGAGIIRQFRVKLPGNPVAGSDYGVYLTGFDASDGNKDEPVEILYNGYFFVAKSPDEAGGIFVQVPVFDQKEIIISAKSNDGHEEVQTFDVIRDDIAPETEAVLGGIMGQTGYYRSDVKINLSAIDMPREGVDFGGVESISYQLDSAPIVITEGASAVLSVGDEGEHFLTYFAKDKSGNIENEKTLAFVVDKTPPELKFNFNQAKKDLAFTAVDNFSAGNDILIVDKNETVIATDRAGNTTRFNFVEKNRRQSLRAQMAKLTYNGQITDLTDGRLAFAWFYGYTPAIPLTITGWQSLPAIPQNLSESDNLTFLLQQAKLKNGSFIVALYGKGKTILLEYKDRKFNLKNYSGLKIINFATSKGDLTWNY